MIFPYEEFDLSSVKTYPLKSRKSKVTASDFARPANRATTVGEFVDSLPDILGSGLYLGASGEVGYIANRFDNSPSRGTLWSGSTFLGADTFLGPAYLGLGYGGAGNWSLYMLLGAP